MSFRTLSSTIALIAEIIPPVVSTDPRCYPFVGKKAVKAALDSNLQLQLATVAMLYHFQTPAEQQARDTEAKNKIGFMSSDAWHGCRLGEALANGDGLAPEDLDRAVKMSLKYSRQLSVALRNKAMADNPVLAQTAGMFSVA